VAQDIKTVPIEAYIESLLKNLKFYKEAVVLDYFENPTNVTEDQVSQYGKNFSIDMIQRCPRGTIVGRPTGDPSPNILFYPFFSNHISLPIKPGEFVWYFEYGRIPYWISRRVSDFGYEDVNYTMASNANRPKNLSEVASPKTAFTAPPPDLSAEQTQSSGKKSDLSLSMLPGDLTYDQIRASAVAKKDIVYEPVPIYSARCGDLAIQGSNNTSIVQGSNFGGGNTQSSGYIDISAGRGRTSETAVKTVNSVASREDLNPGEGEVSVQTDAARIIVSHGIDADTVFSTGLPGGTISPQFAPAVVSKADKIRVIARSDVAVSVEGSNGCSVVLNSNGDVYVNPSASGKVYLSGPESDQAYLRYDEFNQTINRLIDMIAALQSAVPEIVLAAIGAPAAGTTPEIAIEALNNVSPNLGSIELYSKEITLSLLERIKSQKIVGS
jgi:hypothetical protein